MTFQPAPPVPQYPLADKGPNLYHALVEDRQSIPGVRSAAVCSGIPFGAGNYARHPMITTEGSVLPPGTAEPVDWRSISPDYFDTMRIPLLRGRTFTDADVRTAPLVMVVSQSTAQKFFGDADPIGKTLRHALSRSWPTPLSELWATCERSGPEPANPHALLFHPTAGFVAADGRCRSQ
jgi:putative ABC transport system permease protein